LGKCSKCIGWDGKSWTDEAMNFVRLANLCWEILQQDMLQKREKEGILILLRKMVSKDFRGILLKIMD
jgi:hypothetical protein